MAELAVIRSSCENQVVVSDFQDNLVICFHNDLLRGCIDPGYVAKHYRRVCLFCEEAANGRRYLPGRQN